MINLITNEFTYLFSPTKELVNELEEALEIGDWDNGPIMVKKKGKEYTVIINDDLATDMLMKLYSELNPTEWKSILRYLYVMV